MSIKSFTKVLMLVPVMALVVALMPMAPQAAATGETIKQQVGLPAYFIPDVPWNTNSQWDTVTSSAGSNFGFVVANALNGPDYEADPGDYDYTGALSSAHNAGVKVLGYVDTGYFGRTGQKTRSGSTSTDAWRGQIQSDINAWYSFYGSSMDGIFFDQMDNDCGTSNANAKRYNQLRGYVEDAHPTALTVANPGASVPQCYENAADTIITFEGRYACYQQDLVNCSNTALHYTPLSWNHRDPQKIMHLVYETSSTDLADAVADSKDRRAGYVYVTDDSGANPWDTIPSYFSTELSAMSAGGTSDTTAPTAPGTFDTVDVDFLSAQLDWEKSTDAGSGVVAYDLYDNNTGALLKSKGATNATIQDMEITGLLPDTEYDFVLKARDGSGNVSSASNVLTFTTDVDTDTVLYGAPGQPTASNTTYTSVDLTWSHANGGEYARNYYGVYQDGNLIQTVPGPINSTQVIGLTPGSTYSFTVKVFDRSGNVSPLSTARSVTATSLPGGSSIANAGGAINSGTSSVTFSADYLMPWSFRRVFVDVDNNASTGHTPWFESSIGADYIIEGNTLLKSNANGGTWDVSVVSSSGMVPSVSGYTYSWEIPLSTLINAGSTMKAVYQAEGFAPFADTSPVTVL